MKFSFIFIYLYSILLSDPFVVLATDNEALNRARQLYESGKYEAAIQKFKDVINRKKDAVEANTGLAEVYLATGEYGQALTVCQNALERNPGNPDLENQLGELFLKRGRYADARAQFEKIVKKYPDHLRARLNLGIMQDDWGEKTKSRQTLQYFIAYYQNHLKLSAVELTAIARACSYLNRFQDANTLFFDATKQLSKNGQTYVFWGDLFLEKYNIADAQRTFQDALKINPNLAEAHLGLAKCYRTKSFEKASFAAENALNINPNFVAAYNFLSQLSITMGDYDGALEKLDKALEINPNSLTTRTLRAVCFYSQKKYDDYKAEEKRVLRINPKYADLYYQIADMQAKKYLFKESVDFYLKALALNPEHTAALAGYGTSLSRLGEEKAAKDELEKAFSLDPFNKYVGNLLTLFDEFPNYKTHRTGNMLIRIHKKDDPVLADYAVKLAERCFSELEQRYKFDLKKPIVLEIFPEHDDFAVRCFGLPGAQAFLGICFGNVVAMDSPRARNKGDFNWGETLWHELVHVTHLRMTANRIPRWLAEGIAVYETTRANPYWRMNLDVPFIIAFNNDRTLPLKELDSGFNRPTNPGQVTLSYFQASKVVEFIETTYGHAKLLAMFPLFKDGLTSAEVIARVFQLDIDAFDKKFHDFVIASYHLKDVDIKFRDREIPDKQSDAQEKYLSKELAGNGNNPFLNYRFGMYYKKKGDFEKAIPYFEKTKRLFPLFVDKQNPYNALAEIYVEQGQTEEAIQELVQLTALNGKNVNVLNLLADLSLNEKNYPTAIDALRKALYVTPFESAIHEKLAKAYVGTAQLHEAIHELQINLLTNPTDMAGAYCELAAVYLQAGKKADAKQTALKALEIAPNYERAQEILLSAIE